MYDVCEVVDVLRHRPMTYDAVYHMYTHHMRAGPMKRCVADAKVVMLLFIHGLGSRVRAPETTDLVEGGVVTEKRRGHQHQRTQGNTTHNTTDKPLHSTLIGP